MGTPGLGGRGFLPVDWKADLAIFSEEIIPPTARERSSRENSSNERYSRGSREASSAENSQASMERQNEAKIIKKKKKVQRQYNVPYLFSKV